MKNFSSTPLTSMSSQLLRLRQQARRRGMSLVEILIVIAIMAMIGGGVAVFAIPKLQEARVKTAEGSARELRKSVALWQTTEGESGCPTVKQLVESKQIDSASKLEDPWGQKYEIICVDGDVFVTSAGPDKTIDTEDDIQIPQVRDDIDEP